MHVIRPRKNLETLYRDIQPYNSRDGLLRLDMNEYVPYADEELYRELFRRMTYETVSGYPMVNDAYAAISEWLGQPIEKLVLTTGSDGVILSTLQAFCYYGDRVGYVEPAYGMYGVYCDMLGLHSHTVSMDSTLGIDEDALLKLLDKDLKVLMIASPNGVLGTELSPTLIETLVKRGNETGTVILLDEVHADFSDHGISAYTHLTDLYDNLVIARSFSKSYGLAGIRAGYSLSSPEARKYLIAVRSNVEISSVAALAIRVWCDNKEAMLRSLDEINASKKAVAEELDRLNFHTVVGGGNFIIARPPAQAAESIRAALEDSHIKVKYLSRSPEGYMRITVGTKAYMETFLNVIRHTVEGIQS